MPGGLELSSKFEDRRAAAASLRETAVLVGALADARRKAHSACEDPDCTPRAVFEEFNDFIEVAAGLETLALSWVLTGEKAHPTADERKQLAAMVRHAGGKFGDVLRRVAMGEAEA